MKPFAASCEDNKDVIFTVISPYLKRAYSVLEIASGTGQHAVYFANKLPSLKWQTSDLAENLDGINLWLQEAQLNNTLSPLELDVSETWPKVRYDAIFSANSLHIMSLKQVEDCFKGLASVLNDSAVCLFYGPFNYHGEYSSESNKNFDVWLKSRNSLSCIKDFETICTLAKEQGLLLLEDHEMPANNRILAFKKTS